MERQLGRFEHAFALTDDTFGLVAVGVLRLCNGPSPDVVRIALDRAQARHPLLRMHIELRGKRLVFVPTSPAVRVPLRLVERTGENHWRDVTENEVNERIDPDGGCLFRCVYVHSAGKGTNSELVFVSHHAIVDGLSGSRLFDEVLSVCAELEDDVASDVVPITPLNHRPPVDDLLPPAFRGMRLSRRLVSFLIRQLQDDLRYKKKTATKHPDLIHPPSRCHIHSLALTAQDTEELVRRSRRERVSLNSTLSAALLLALYRRSYHPDPVILRTLVFSDMRPHLTPPVAPEHLGCYIAMLRVSAPIAPDDTLWTVARNINDRVYTANKRGDRYLAVLMSRMVMRRLLRKRNERMATTALSYAGPVPIHSSYGSIEVLDMHSFITTNSVSPQFSAFGHLLSGRLILDFMYQEADMGGEEARNISHEIQRALTS